MYKNNDSNIILRNAATCCDVDFNDDDEFYEQVSSDIAFGTLAAFEDMSTLSVRQLNKHSSMGFDTVWKAQTLERDGCITTIRGEGTARTKANEKVQFTYKAEIDATERRYYVNCDVDDVTVDIVFKR